MFCPSCGAEFADWAHTCPYCGTVNEAVDEKLYMEHMEELRKRMDVVDDEAEKKYQRSISDSVKKTLKIAGIVVGLALVIVLFVLVRNKIADRRDEKFQMDQYEWRKEEYQKLNALYEAGDYAGALEEIYASTEDNEYTAGTWEHYYFVYDFYSYYQNMQMMKTEYAENDLDSYILGEGLYGAVYLVCYADDDYLDRLQTSYSANNGSYGITEEERTIILTYREEAEEILHDTVGWSDEEIETMYEDALDNDWLTIRPFFKKAEEMLGE